MNVIPLGHSAMFTPLRSTIGIWVGALVIHLNCWGAADAGVISRDGWSYDREGFNEPQTKVAEAKKAGNGLRLTGWVEYDVTIPDTGWYELMLGGCPPEWAPDVIVDEKVITQMQGATPEDKLNESPRGRAEFKQVNMFLSKGSHVLRLRRNGKPELLPSVWELRPSGSRSGNSLRAVVDGSRIVEPGGSVAVKILGGTTVPTEYEFFLRNEVTGDEFPVGKMKFPVVPRPAEQSLVIPFLNEGFYMLLAKSGAVMLKPSDLKAGYFLAAPRVKSTADASQDQAFQFAGIFANGAVLQQEKPLPVWGWSAPGDNITVSLAGQEEKAVAAASGRWMVTFKPLKAGGKPMEITAVAASGKTISVKDVLVGEVWLLSGQSNMGGPLVKAPGGRELAEQKDYPELRLFNLHGRPTAKGEMRTVQYDWVQAVFGGQVKPGSCWSPLHYMFGLDLFKQLKVPVGLITGSRGGTSISTWTSRQTIESEPSWNGFWRKHREDSAEPICELVHLNELAEIIARWRAATTKATSEGKPAPQAPELKSDCSIINGPSYNFDALIQPVAPFAIRGVLWYQGEADCSMAELYRKRFPALIRSWRELWKNPEMPFHFVQIAYSKGEKYVGEPGDEPGSELKEAQTLALSVPHTAMAVTDDLMKPGNDIHYPDKLPVGHRLALTALATVYNRQVEYSGPVYKSLKVEDGAIRLFFKHAEGLAVKGEALNAFAIAGEDRKWVWADAKIDGETVLVRSPKVPNPVAVRYSWAPSPRGGNLVNQAGLPCPVFRTDDWPMVTAGFDL